MPKADHPANQCINCGSASTKVTKRSLQCNACGMTYLIPAIKLVKLAARAVKRR